MKPLRVLDAPTPGLADYLAIAGDKGDWNEFRSHRGGGAYRELIEKLIDLQHGLCGYCEIGLAPSNRQVEHVIPRSHGQCGPEKALDRTNMIACCRGGERRSGDPAQFRTPIGENRSCGQRKGDHDGANFVDPRKLPPSPSPTRVTHDGRIVADANACRAAGLSPDDVRETIEILGLNVERLRLRREAIWDALSAAYGDYVHDPGKMRAAAHGGLLPDADDRLPEFFTTARSYFARWGEDILALDSRWI